MCSKVLLAIMIGLFTLGVGGVAFCQDVNEEMEDADIATWVEDYDSGTLTLDTVTDVSGPGVRYEVSSTVTSSWIKIGISDDYPVAHIYGFPWNVGTPGWCDWTGYTQYQLRFENNHATDWVNVKAYYTTRAVGDWHDSGDSWLAPGQSVVKTIDLTGDPYLTDVTNIGFEIGANYGTNDYEATEFDVIVTARMTANVTLETSTALMKCSDNVIYSVMVDDEAYDLMGADYKINYDSTKLSFVSAVVGDLLNTGAGEYIFTYLPSTGVLHINSSHLATGVNGPGEIAEVTFQAIAATVPGSTSLTFSDGELRDSGNQTLPSTWIGASVAIDCIAPTITVTLDAPASPWTCYKVAPTVDIGAGDDYDLDCVKYKIDAGSWVDIVCGLSGTSYTNNDWALPDFGLLSEGSHTYYFKSTDDAGNESSETSVTFTKDTVDPSAVTDFTATVGHNQVVLDWTNPGSDVDRIYLYRNDWTSYPAYGTADPGYPTVGSYGSETDVGAVETYTDGFTNTTRGIYAYRAVVYDCAGNYAAAGSGDYDRATSYFLGDIASTAGSWSPNYDGLVSGFDYNPFSGCYWASPPTGTCLEADFGPTIEPTRGSFGIPVPDAYVGFEDLMIFAINYGNVPPPGPPGAPLLGVELAAVGLVEEATSYRLSLREVSEAGDMVELALVVEGNDVFKGLSAEVSYDHSGLEFVSVMPSEALLRGSRVLFMGDEVEGVVRVDLAALGGGVGIGGNGPVAMLSFRRSGESGSSVRITSADARDVDNNVLLLSVDDEIRVEPGMPEAFALRGNSPNPFTGSTEISYDIPREAAVMLRIYNIHGQVVRTLVDGAVAAGRHSETWDGRDGQGRKVSAGVYFCKMKSGPFASTHKMMISR